MECQERLSKDTCCRRYQTKENIIISLQVTSEQVHDGKVLPKLVDDITIKNNKIIDMTIADSAYDSNNNFQFLSFKQGN